MCLPAADHKQPLLLGIPVAWVHIPTSHLPGVVVVASTSDDGSLISAAEAAAGSADESDVPLRV